MVDSTYPPRGQYIIVVYIYIVVYNANWGIICYLPPFYGNQKQSLSEPVPQSNICNPSYDSALRFVHRKRPAWPCLPLVFSQDRIFAVAATRLNLPAVDERGEGYVIWVERTSYMLPLDFLWLILLYIAIHKSLVWILFFLV